ncbi:PapI protein [Escherichia coli]|nr:PapI protein [Escherichia coli]TJK41467.1 PapI protein [Escherichia coli]
MLPSETMIWQPEFTDKTLSRKPGAVQSATAAPLPGQPQKRKRR